MSRSAKEISKQSSPIASVRRRSMACSLGVDAQSVEHLCSRPEGPGARALWHGCPMQPRAGAGEVPVVSVVLCVRNGASTLTRQLAALTRQDFGAPWEVVLVDNGSTDGTRALATAWTDRMPWLPSSTSPSPG